MERSIVVVSREYKDLEIHHRVVLMPGEIRIECSLEEFIQSLAQEMGPTVCVTKKQLLEKLKEKVVPVISAMKSSTRFNPPPLKRPI